MGSVNLCGAESSRVRVRGAPKTDLLAPESSGVGGAAGAAAAGRALDDQTDPLAPAAGRRRRIPFSLNSVGGER
jgi:hypothetical protein